MNSKRIQACACALALTLGLAACGGQTATTTSGQSDDAAASTAAATYDFASVDYEGWTLDFGTPEVVWSEEDETDLVVVPVRATNNGDEARRLANVDNFLVYYNEDDDYLDTAYNSDLLDLAAEDEDVGPGESIELTYVFEADGNYGTMRFVVQGYTVSEDDTEVEFTTEATDERTAFAEAAEADLAAKRDAGEAEIVGATVTKPEGWYFDELEEKSMSIVSDDSTGTYVKLAFSTVGDTPVERAAKYAGNYGLDESSVQTATVNGVEWAYFIPTDTQFQAYA